MWKREAKTLDNGQVFVKTRTNFDFGNPLFENDISERGRRKNYPLYFLYMFNYFYLFF